MFETHLSHFQCHDDPNATEIPLQALLQDLGRGQGTVAAFNDLSNHLLLEYSTDDTRRIKEVTDKHNAAWNSINNRYVQTPLFICLHIPFVNIKLEDDVEARILVVLNL